MLTACDRALLLDLAHAAIRAAVSGTAGPAVPPTALPDAAGLFVTIRRDGVLRGCLGTLEIRTGLAREVVRVAAESALEDPRFPAVAPAELPTLALEISVLGRLQPIASRPDAFVVGIHGLVVEHGTRRGLLLPQVAVEQRWTADEFLRRACVKAGLPPDAWTAGARVSRFGADVFGD